MFLMLKPWAVTDIVSSCGSKISSILQKCDNKHGVQCVKAVLCSIFRPFNGLCIQIRPGCLHAEDNAAPPPAAGVVSCLWRPATARPAAAGATGTGVICPNAAEADLPLRQRSGRQSRPPLRGRKRTAGPSNSVSVDAAAARPARQ